MEEEAASSLSTLLQTLLLSVERAIERVPLDELSFPCPDCQEVLMTSCACACQVLPLVVEKRDSSIQTSPMFEYAGSIPHIDSDEESVASHEDKGTYRRLQGNKSEASTMTTLAPQREEPVLIPPGSIRELTEKVLMCGIHLPGIHDCEGRAVVVLDTTSLTRVCLEPHQVASLLLYYNTLPRPERLKDGLTLLVVSGAAEHSTLSLLDKALLLVVKQMKVGSVLIWRRPDCSYKGNTRLETSKIRCQVIKDETNLRQLLPEDQLPTSCGGRTSHDQIEWVEFYKELEPLLSASHACGRRLAAAMADLRATEGAPTRRQLHHQHRALARALADPELHRLRREGIGALGRLQERAHWLPASEDVRLGTERARQVFTEVDRAARRLEQLSEGRREKLRELARVRALEDESTQVLSWLSKKGEETLQRHAQLATNLPAIKEQEQDFEKFYFISMRHLDKGGDLLEECSGSGETPRASTPGSGGSGLRELARSLKHHLRGFSDRLEDTRERLEDTSRCFYLLDKAYEWSLETMKYMSRVKVDDSATTDQTLQMLKQLQQYLMAHPSISEEHFTEMWQLARKLGNEKLLEQSKVAHSRCQETMELIRSQQSRLNRPQDCDSLDHSCPTRPTSPRPAHQAPWEGPASSTPVQSGGRRRSVGSHPYIYKCSHHAAGHTCSCWEPPSPAPEEDCACPARPTNLGDIREVRESAEDLLEADGEVAVKSVGDGLCTRCSGSQTSDSGNSSSGGPPVGKRHLQRSCTWQFPTENFDDDDGAPCNGRLCGEEGHKCGYSTDHTTEGSEGCPKSAEDLEDQEAVCGNKVVPPVPVNSHLHCHPSTLDLSGSKEIKTQKTLLLIMREMIQTERDYVKSLDYIIENYIPELLREDIPQAMRGQRNVIFGNVEKIFEFHNQYFLQELEQCEISPLQVGQCFLRHEKKFYLYALYNKNKPKSDSLMSEYGTMFFKSKQIELGDKMDLASYLLKPVQRMGKYALLLQQLMKACRDKEGDVSELRSAEEMVRFQLRHGNDLLAMDSLRDCDVNVKEQGRLMRQNEFLVWQGKGKKCLRHVFLFEELILFSKARRFPDRKNLDLYIYKNSIKMTDIGLTAKIGDSPTKFEIWFRKRKPNDTFTLQSMSEEIKRVWTEELSKLLWKQALRNREMRLAEMSSMGIGNKPCLDIRPSADQISDRSISIAQLSKTAPRFRNSITVAPGELLRTNKRPHSIISVSSSSSSGASHSSGSGYGALINLGFDPADSPRLHHRSTTLQSQGSVESGIIADMSLGSEDTDGSGPHWHVERSNSSVTSMSLDSSLSPTSPVSPLEEDKGDLGGVKATDVTEDYLQGEEMSVKL